MPLLIDEQCYDIMCCGPWGSFLSTERMASDECLYDTANFAGKNGAMPFLAALEYLNSYGRDPSRVRVLMTPATSLGPHGFNLAFQWRRGGKWLTEMTGGLVFRAGEGWSVHT